MRWMYRRNQRFSYISVTWLQLIYYINQSTAAFRFYIWSKHYPQWHCFFGVNHIRIKWPWINDLVLEKVLGSVNRDNPSESVINNGLNRSLAQPPVTSLLVDEFFCDFAPRATVSIILFQTQGCLVSYIITYTMESQTMISRMFSDWGRGGRMELWLNKSQAEIIALPLLYWQKEEFHSKRNANLPHQQCIAVVS